MNDQGHKQVYPLNWLCRYKEAAITATNYSVYASTKLLVQITTAQKIDTNSAFLVSLITCRVTIWVGHFHGRKNTDEVKWFGYVMEKLWRNLSEDKGPEPYDLQGLQRYN